MVRYRNLLAFLVLAGLWGTAFMAIKAGLTYFPPVLFAAFRYDVAGLLMLGYAVYATDQWWPRDRNEWALVGVGAGLLNPAQQASVADVVGNDRSGGKVLAGFQMCQDAGGIGGPILVGLVADHGGWGWAFALSGVISLVAVLPWLRAQETLLSHRG